MRLLTVRADMELPTGIGLVKPPVGRTHEATDGICADLTLRMDGADSMPPLEGALAT